MSKRAKSNLAGYREWHLPRNEECPHNSDPAELCRCKRPRKPANRKPYRRVRVNDRTAEHGFRSRMEVRIYPDGVLELKEHGRRRLYRSTVFSLYKRCVMAEAFAEMSARKAAKAERRKHRRKERKAKGKRS